MNKQFIIKTIVVIIFIFAAKMNIGAALSSYSQSNQIIGKIESDGKIFDRSSMNIGKVDNSGSMYDRSGMNTGKYVSPGYNSEDDTYPFVPDPGGNYYHFESFVTMGDSPWDIFERYQETFTASSTLAPSKTISYDANNLRNEQRTEDGERGGGGNRSTTWCEGVKGYGIGECITMSLRTKAQIAGKEDEIGFSEVMIVNGYAKNATVWKNNSRVKTLSLSINGEHWCTFQLKDVISPQIFYLPDNLHIYPAKSGKKIPGKGAFRNALDDAYDEEGYDEKWPVYQTDLVFEILEVFPGEKYDDTCITGITLDVRGGGY